MRWQMVPSCQDWAGKRSFGFDSPNSLRRPDVRGGLWLIGGLYVVLPRSRAIGIELRELDKENYVGKISIQ